MNELYFGGGSERVAAKAADAALKQTASVLWHLVVNLRSTRDVSGVGNIRPFPCYQSNGKDKAKTKGKVKGKA